jgi:Flp pilus assembly protein TadB
MLLMTADIFSFVVVALATDNARISVLEADLKASIEALKSANVAKVSAKRAAKSVETRAKKAKKALADANQKQAKREQSIAERLDHISVSIGSKCCIISFGYLLRLLFDDMCLLVFVCVSVVQQRKLENLGYFGNQVLKILYWPWWTCWNQTGSLFRIFSS